MQTRIMARPRASTPSCSSPSPPIDRVSMAIAITPSTPTPSTTLRTRWTRWISKLATDTTQPPGPTHVRHAWIGRLTAGCKLRLCDRLALSVQCGVQSVEGCDRKLGRADEHRGRDPLEIIRRAVIVGVVVHAQIQERHLRIVEGGVVRGLDPVVLAGVLRRVLAEG